MTAPSAPGLPRPIEALAALTGLAFAAPLMALGAIAVRLDSPGPILFRQQRVGRGGRLFEMVKFRTMRVNSGTMGVTARDDQRITLVGKILRKTKLDELPELWHVVRGQMSFVGHRPEVPRYVDQDDPLWREALRARPGLADPNALNLRNEEDLVAQVAGDREAFYLRVLQPYKLLVSTSYLRTRSWKTDVRMLLAIAVAVVQPYRAPPTVEEIERRVTEYRESLRS
jgi:lipopolysaccharide/colanic/teichoic acid biosynthesis glycosyltransferase